MEKLKSYLGIPDFLEEEKKVVLGLSLMTLLAVYFSLSFVVFIYYPGSSLDFRNPGFWIFLLNNAVITTILILNKWIFNWRWKDLGFSKPKTWWQPVLTFLGTLSALLLFSLYIRPLIIDKPDISHLMVLRQNLPLLILSLILVWITAAFLEELIFRAFLINGLDYLLGEKRWSIWVAVIISSVIFGLIHGWQGLSGIFTTSFIGLIFGIAYVLNGRRILPLILVHGFVDTITLVNIYNMEIP